MSLAVQLNSMRVHVAMLQECRAGFSGIKSAGCYWRIACAGSAGNYGCEVWISKVLPFGVVYDKNIYITKDDLSIILCTLIHDASSSSAVSRMLPSFVSRPMPHSSNTKSMWTLGGNRPILYITSMLVVRAVLSVVSMPISVCLCHCPPLVLILLGSVLKGL